MVMDVSRKRRTTEEEVDEQHQVGTIPLVTFTYHQGGGAGKFLSKQKDIKGDRERRDQREYCMRILVRVRGGSHCPV